MPSTDEISVMVSNENKASEALCLPGCRMLFCHWPHMRSRGLYHQGKPVPEVSHDDNVQQHQCNRSHWEKEYNA